MTLTKQSLETWLPELNSLQVAKLRKLIEDAEKEAIQAQQLTTEELDEILWYLQHKTINEYRRSGSPLFKPIRDEAIKAMGNNHE